MKPKLTSDGAFQAVTFAAGLFLLIYALVTTDFKVKISDTPLSALMGLAGLLLTLYPFIKYLKIGEYFEFRTKLNDVQDKTSKLKQSNEEIRSLVSTLLISNQQSQAQEINIYNAPSTDELDRERQKVATSQRYAPVAGAQVASSYQITDQNILSMTKLRIAIEKTLQKIATDFGLGSARLRQFRGARETFSLLTNQYPDVGYLGPALDDTLGVANAVIHGRYVENPQVEKAVELGQEVIRGLDGFYEYLSKSR